MSRDAQHVRLVVPDVDRFGGVFQSASRLAAALTEAGITCDMVSSPRDEQLARASAPTIAIRRSTALSGIPSVDAHWRSTLRCDLAAGNPDLLVVGQGNLEVLRAARQIAPTVLHAHMNWAACPDATRYWSRADRECTVQAGRKCLALRPVLGCTSLGESLRSHRVRALQRLQELLISESIPVICISGSQMQLLRRHGLPADRLTVVPNLGLRLTAAEIAAAAASVPAPDRGAVTFFGRLTKAKGAQLLPDLAQAARAPGLRVYGDGYLGQALRGAIPEAIRGNVPQAAVAGILTWASATVVPSVWPEPGGIVGIDAQLFGVPTAAFSLGAALDWPGVTAISPRNREGMVRWVASRSTIRSSRDPAEISERLSAYWSHVGARAAGAVRDLVACGRFSHTSITAVTDDLRAAGVNPTE